MSRPDESITYLKDRGYCVLRMPRSDMKPLQTLIRAGKKDLNRLGELASIMVKGKNELPTISRDNIAPGGISGKETSKVKVEIGVTILGGIIRALGGNDLGLSTAFGKGKSITFKFENVLEDHSDVDLLDQFLSTAAIKPDQKTVTTALLEDEVYVITSTIKTNKFTVNAAGDNNVKVALDVPVIQQAVSGNLKIETGKAVEGTVSYEGITPVVFGFQAVQLMYDDQSLTYTAVNILQPGAAAARAAGVIKPAFLTLDEGVFFRLHESPAAAIPMAA